MSEQRKAIQGSERRPIPGARAIGRTHPEQRIEVSVVLRPGTPIPSPRRGMARMSHEEFAQRHGATSQDIEAIRQFARENGLTVVEHPRQAARRTVVLSGTVQDFEKAFGVELQEYECPHFTYRGREGAIQIPGTYAEIVRGVFGLDDRPQAKPHYRWREAPGTRRPSAANAVSYTPVQVAQL